MTVQSIMLDPPGREFSYGETLKQIGIGTMMGVGWQAKTMIWGTRVHDWFKVKVSGRYWLVIKLNASDLYDVEVGRMRLMDYEVLEQERNVYAEDLAGVVRRLGDLE